MALVSKPIRAVLEKGPNYIFHLMAVARNGFDSDYAGLYEALFPPGDLEVLRKYRNELSFSDGTCGQFTYLMIFLPGYLNLDTEAALSEYFSLLGPGAEEGYGPFLSRYREAFRRLEAWGIIYTEAILESLCGDIDATSEIAQVYLGSFGGYESDVWPVESRKMAPVAEALNSHFCNADVIAAWESMTGLNFRFNEYQIVLCSAIANGPNANSLGYERNVFFHDSPVDWLQDFISHETGTHLLIDLEREQRCLPREESQIAYKAFENLARFCNRLILGREPVYHMPPWYDESRFDEIYGRLWAGQRTVGLRELYQTAIWEYIGK